MSISVTFSDPTGRYTSQSSLLVRNFEAAWAMWSAYLAPTDASIEVNFHLVSDYANRGGGRSLTSVAEVTTSSGVIAAQGAAFELRTGIDPNGAAADIEVFFDVDFMATWYWIDPLDGSTTPSGKNNLVDVIAHELGHALGFNGFINQTTYVKPQYISRFDQLIEVRDGAPFFTGEKAVAIYGGAVPITPGNVFHVGSSPNFRMDSDLMNGLVLTTGYRYAISALDVAILSDTGVATVLSDKLIGSEQGDRIYGGAGDDVITSFGGNDIVNGGEGIDTAVYTGASSAYSWIKQASGAWLITDSQAGRDGVDTVTGIELLRFSDRTVTLEISLPAVVQAAYSTILRSASNGAYASDLQLKLAAGALTPAAAIQDVIKTADNTTSVATLAYQFFTGATPGVGGMDYLVSPTGPNANNLNSAYYQSFSLENRYINFAVNLGKAGAGQASFQAGYGSLSLAESLSKAYATIFGSTPSAGKVDLLLNGMVPDGLGGTETRAQYFAFYGQDGVNGLGAKAAMVGWLLGEAVKADLGSYSLSNDAFLTAIANGTTTYGVDLIGQFDNPSYRYVSG